MGTLRTLGNLVGAQHNLNTRSGAGAAMANKKEANGKLRDSLDTKGL